MHKSRLNEHLQKQAIRNILLVLFGVLVLSVLVIIFGMQFLINFSMAIEKYKNPKDQTNNDQELIYIAPPVLNPLQSATNSAKVNVSGYSSSIQTIKLFVNGKLVDNTATNSDKSFVFDSVPLEQGSNEIKAKSISEANKQSDFSNIVTIMYNSKAPTLEINSPTDGQSFSKDPNQINITGKTDPGNRVTVNDFWSIVDDQGNFSYIFKLQNGENKIKVVATDDAGNNSTKEIKVTYSQ